MTSLCCLGLRTASQKIESVFSCQGRKSRIRWFGPVAEASELPDRPCSACLLGLLADGGATFLATDSLVQDKPDQSTLSARDGPDRLIVSQARDRAAIDNLEDASFGLGCSVGTRALSVLSRRTTVSRHTRSSEHNFIDIGVRRQQFAEVAGAAVHGSGRVFIH